MGKLNCFKFIVVLVLGSILISCSGNIGNETTDGILKNEGKGKQSSPKNDIHDEKDESNETGNGNKSNIEDGNEENENVVTFPYEGPSKEIEGISYTEKQKKIISEFSQEYGIQSPYIPTIGVANDYVIAVRKDEDAMTITFPHFSIRQSSENFIQAEKNENIKSIQIKNGTAKWYENKRTLYLKIGDVYVSIISAKSVEREEFIAIAESLTQIKNT